MLEIDGIVSVVLSYGELVVMPHCGLVLLFLISLLLGTESDFSSEIQNDLPVGPTCSHGNNAHWYRTWVEDQTLSCS